jgi:hypothetical protein
MLVAIWDDDHGKIEVGQGFGQTIKATRPDGEVRRVIMIESREEYDYEMAESMKWLGIVDEQEKP